jgi:transposase
VGVTRLLWVGKERTIESFQGFFTAMGKDVISKIAFVCSDMWELDRFHIVANMNKALDNVRADALYHSLGKLPEPESTHDSSDEPFNQC